MTTRLPDQPMRVTNWLAGWVDYVFAIALVAGRWLRLPLTEPDREPGFRSAFAPTMADSFAPRWHEGEHKPPTGGLVRAAEIAMLSVSFFLGAHLLSGGTPAAIAPNLNPMNLIAEHDGARATPIASQQVEITIAAASLIVNFDQEPAEVLALETEQAALLPLPEAPAAIAAAVPGGAGTEAAPAMEPPVAPLPAAAAPAKPTAVAETAGRYMTTDEIRAAASTAGWPAELLDEVVSVARCESTFFTHAEYYGALGLMQMMPLWFAPAGLDSEMWADPVTNLRAARYAYLENERNYGNAWGPWTCKPERSLNTAAS